jgi:hypothetical protein
MIEKQKAILEHFKDLNVTESLELITNVIAAIAFMHMEVGKESRAYPRHWDEYYEMTMRDVKENKESLANALARQALTMNMWITQRKSK